jgi:hypothetical protein
MGGVISARTDPEVARLLRIGRYTPPAVDGPVIVE